MRKIKEIQPSYIVNMDDIESLDDIDLAFALAKHNAKLPLDDSELKTIVDHAVEIAAPKVVYIFDCTEPTSEKKDPWYKRMWKKIKSIFAR